MTSENSSEEHLRFFEETQDSESVFSGQLLQVYRDRVRLPDGYEAVREYIRHPGAVVIIAVQDDGRLLFERQFRYPLRREFLEFPAGKLEAGEPDFSAAQRELREETGYVAQRWRHLGRLHTCIGYSDERIEIFWAEQLSYVGVARDPGELLALCAMTLDEALSAVRTGDITDGKTVAALLWAEKVIRGDWAQ
jgi:ADP-ribose pyrophosphatase